LFAPQILRSGELNIQPTKPREKIDEQFGSPKTQVQPSTSTIHFNHRSSTSKKLTGKLIGAVWHLITYMQSASRRRAANRLETPDRKYSR
jgi:hypothetical protein